MSQQPKSNSNVTTAARIHYRLGRQLMRLERGGGEQDESQNDADRVVRAVSAARRAPGNIAHGIGSL